MKKNHLKDHKVKVMELDEEVMVVASVAARRLGIPLSLFVNQALQEKLVGLLDESLENATPPPSR